MTTADWERADIGVERDGGAMQDSNVSGDEEAPPRGATTWARLRPDHPAVVFEGTARTYGELDDRARRLAGVLREHGATSKRTVAAVLRNGIEMMEVALASAMIDAPFLPINWHLKSAELAYLLEDAGVGVLVGDEALRDELEAALAGQPTTAVPRRALFTGDDYERALASEVADPSLDAGPGPQLVFYTSGTTSRPKGVVHAGLGSEAIRGAAMDGQAQLWQWTCDDVYVLAGPAYHASHGGWALTALWVGATTVMLPRFSAHLWLDAVQRHHGTRSFMVPAHFIRLLELSDEERASYDVSSLQLIVHGAAPCPITVKQRMMEAFPYVEIHELYGASEGGATRISPQEWRERPGSVGRPWPGVEVRVLDEDGSSQPVGQPGVVWIRPPGQQQFVYRNNPEATANAWRDGAFTVGDIGFLDDDGYLTITDRVSDMILWGGVNVAPREIEEVLYQHPAVVDCAVFGIPDDRDGEHIKALVEIRPELLDQVTTDLLADHVRGQLADYKVPHEWEIVEELPRDPNGKVIKRLLRTAHQARA